MPGCPGAPKRWQDRACFDSLSFRMMTSRDALLEKVGTEQKKAVAGARSLGSLVPSLDRWQLEVCLPELSILSSLRGSSDLAVLRRYGRGPQDLLRWPFFPPSCVGACSAAGCPAPTPTKKGPREVVEGGTRLHGHLSDLKPEPRDPAGASRRLSYLHPCSRT